jgi:uncharacterized tellurite resistance protein B-like protein
MPVMLRAIRRALASAQEDTRPPGHERRQLQLAVAMLLHEARRADYEQGDPESAAGEEALVELFDLERREAAELLNEGRAKAEVHTSFYAPVSIIKRDFSMPERIRLVGHLWRVTFADKRLDQYEDHYVRKIAHLLYVPNTESMLARNRARG